MTKSVPNFHTSPTQNTTQHIFMCIMSLFPSDFTCVGGYIHIYTTIYFHIVSNGFCFRMNNTNQQTNAFQTRAERVNQPEKLPENNLK